MIDLNKPLWQLTVAELLELSESLKPKFEPVIEEKYFSPKEACAYLLKKNLRVSASTLYRWRKQRVLEAQKLGGVLTYSKSDLDNLLTKNR
jgi:IS30 family transposase